ncbi:hypothetical protein CI109_103946 [Kwoniella shandongensis]|uniref:Uncharacterized protein n=1 Tax=Kwoniella shandongensis TaxID=1734106 RepID=A0A5M6BT28_9TREE|nr:uncharacterized protein CI109_005600 [Kwoniella shandongensis]KAA5526004.1 hypothetical protein CI109_005600 [Kwoniella shandongensis]
MTRRHSLHPLPRAFAPHRSEGSRRSDEGMWEKLDRVQVLGGDDGHVGCVNALSWSDDGRTLLSGSDDRRICIWQPDPSPSSSSSSSSPHPLKLMESISTGHRANIFSAKFLPNANTPTIVSCAGDREVRVFEVERLGREESGGWGMGTGSGRNRGELFGHSGDGVRVLRCHTDRTKRIATENSPFLFLTVSEDGTVRQHDLRRPHVCRSECPEALFYAPKGVDLYSLSVSTVTPHIFAVAGRTEHAYICDRRMLQRQTPTWGPHARASGQVHCVRKLGLPDEEWSKVTPDRGDRFFREERHTTCVKMSAEHADEVVVAFAKHSTSLFSIYDSPPSDSARARSASPTIIPPNREADRARQSPNRESGIVIPSTPTGGVVPSNSHFNSEKKHQDVWSPTQETKHENEQETLQLGKRRLSDRSTLPADLEEAPQSRLRTNDRLILPTPAGPSASGPGGGLEPGRAEEIAREMGFLPGDQDNSDSPGIDPALLDEDVGTEMIMGPPSPTVPSEFRSARDFLRDDLMDLEEDDRRELNFEGAQDATLSDLENMAIDLLDEDDENELDAMDFDEEDEYDEDDEEEDDEDILSITAGSNSSRVPAKAFDSVETIFPRRSFKGARNMETVKDCNFLGTRSDKVCSGSDDGNFFVWDKDTGRLEGIWEGDGSVVNVMEQHPTLPLIAVSGIDNTVKMFAPTSKPPIPSFNRTHRQSTIIERNTRSARFYSGGAFDRATILQFLASRGVVTRVEGDDDDDDGGGEMGDEGGVRGCATQ